MALKALSNPGTNRDHLRGRPIAPACRSDGLPGPARLRPSPADPGAGRQPSRSSTSRRTGWVAAWPRASTPPTASSSPTCRPVLRRGRPWLRGRHLRPRPQRPHPVHPRPADAAIACSTWPPGSTGWSSSGAPSTTTWSGRSRPTGVRGAARPGPVDGVDAVRTRNPRTAMPGRAPGRSTATGGHVPRRPGWLPRRRRRFAGLPTALHAAGLPAPAPVRCAFDVAAGEAGRDRACCHAAAAPDVIVCANDEIALGVHLAAEAAGLRVPEDLAVTGWDDVLAARFAGSPPSANRCASSAPPPRAGCTGASPNAHGPTSRAAPARPADPPHPARRPAQLRTALTPRR